MRAGTGRAASLSFGELAPPLPHLLDAPERLADRAALIHAIDQLAAGIDNNEALRRAGLDLIAAHLATGREKLRDLFLLGPAVGLRAARSHAHLTDVAVAGVLHLASTHLHSPRPRIAAERLSLIATGGYGRGELAPHSDVDLLFLTPWKRTPWAETIIETVLYLLWDLKLRMGHATRSIADCLTFAKNDMTVRTALLEQRFLAGDAEPAAELERRLWAELFLATGPEFVTAKLEERDLRHARNGGSRYLLEPNVKASKGGLRDLQTLHWISRYLFQTRTAWELVARGIFRRDEVELFAAAAKFIWAVRCHLHDLSGRAEDRLSFDRQVEIAARMGYRAHDGRMAVEHFMQDYFRHAKAVGDLTRIFSAALEAQHVTPTPPAPPELLDLDGSTPGATVTLEAGWLVVPDLATILTDPINMMRLFAKAAQLDARIHPSTMRLITQNLPLVDESFRNDPQANALFLDILCNRKNVERMLRLMNETGFLGQFIPEFGRIVGMMQFNMYHHYTVDEHIIRAIGILAEIERQEDVEAHPLSTAILGNEGNSRVLYVALLLHDIGKGDPRDHSELGAEIAARLCPRLTLSEAETETIIWLIRHHLLMSDIAQKRDIQDPRTIADFAREVQSPQRLRLLLVLTVCDIRAVGPGVWTGWKAQLLRDLYHATRDLLTGDSDEPSRAARVYAAQQALARVLDWPADAIEREIARHQSQYWLGFDTAAHVLFAELAQGAGPGGIGIRFLQDPHRGTTMACFHIADHLGLFARMAGALALGGADVIDARSYTTEDRFATAIFWIQDQDARPFPSERLKRLQNTTERALRGEISTHDLAARNHRPRREQSFRVPLRILFDNAASDRHTLIEVNASDRPGLLHDLAGALAGLDIDIVTAIIATYGARAVDVFYVKDRNGLKISSKSELAEIERRLIEAVTARRTVDPARNAAKTPDGSVAGEAHPGSLPANPDEPGHG